MWFVVYLLSNIYFVPVPVDVSYFVHKILAFDGKKNALIKNFVMELD